MNDAGRILPMPKGTYDAGTPYEMLDFVYYQGKSYIAKQKTTGNTPEDGSEYWQLFAAGNDSTEFSVTDTEGLKVEKGHETSLQTLLDEIANRIVNKLVTSDALTTKLGDYLTREMLSDADVDDSAKIPTSKFVHGLSGKIDTLLSTAMRRNIYRGKSLGESVTEEQWAAIKSGSFTDMFIGDYWTISEKVYRIADMDYLYNCGDTIFNTHHLIIVPDTNMGNQKMNDGNDTTGAYVGSKMRTTYMNEAKTAIKAAFGDAHILTYRDCLANGITNGYASAGGWQNCDIELMNERMVYGSPCFNPTSNGTAIPYNYTVCKSQLSLFRLDPKAITTRYTYWLRDVVSAAYFAFVVAYGHADYGTASASRGVRPFFAIGQLS